MPVCSELCHGTVGYTVDIKDFMNSIPGRLTISFGRSLDSHSEQRRGWGASIVMNTVVEGYVTSSMLRFEPKSSNL